MVGGQALQAGWLTEASKFCVLLGNMR